jgi:glycosyltransferase involved in cell wall biosynthesis
MTQQLLETGRANTPARQCSLQLPLRLAILCDFPEENWPSMDLCAEMLVERIKARWQDRLLATRLCPPFRRRLTAVPKMGQRGWAHNGDRFLNRHHFFPRHLRRRREEFDLFHICDHSYSQLALELPGDRTGVLCHDVDAFRCLVEPTLDPRPRWFRWMMGRVLRGMRKAAVVFHTTTAVKDEILRLGLVGREKLVHAPLGYAPEFTSAPIVDAVAQRILANLQGRPFLLHVGSCIPRKCVDFLLEVFAAVRESFPELRLVKVGGLWSAEQDKLTRSLGLASAIVHVRDLARSTLAKLYQEAALVMLPSEAEGFGLPVVEALACGARVLASDLPVLREVGGEAVIFAPPRDLHAWREQVTRVLGNLAIAPPRDTRLAQSRRFSWEEHVRIIVATYQELAA